ncbi:hypothetical protein ACFC0S_03155 [Streptomyces sp. NPDC056084]|uniref:hypothetical protein n=1 Tax=unclassified Streptomyces TaxID=2593676 RepID=UPI0035DCFCD6
MASASWCVDHLLRNAGIHTCPPPRQGCILYASLHGGAAANIGTLTRLEGMWKFWTKDQAPHEMCFDWYAGKSTAEYVPSVRPVNRGNTPGLFYEAWINNANIPGDGLVESGIEFTMAWSDANNQLTYTSALMQFNTAIKTTQMVVAVGTNEDPSKNGGATWDGWDVKPKKGTFHLGLWMEFDSSGKAILLPRLTAPDGVVHFGVPASSPSAVPPGSLAFIRLVIQNLRVEAVQLSQLATRPLGAALTQTGMWQKTATLDLPDAPLRVIPQVSGSAWDVITQIAAATLSTAEFDTNGVFRWQGRNRWSIAPATPSLTVTSDRELASLTVTEEIDACRNYITVPWDNWLSVQTTDSVANPLYNVARLGPGEWAELWWLVGDNQFDAMPPLTKPGAVGENAIRFVSADSDSAPQVFGAVEVGLRKVDGRFYLTMRNRSTSVVFLRGATSGAVSVNVKSPAVSSGDNPVRYSATSQNTTSQAAYRVQTYNHDSGGWVQTAESATAVADALLKAGQYPAPILGDVEILPDPRLQLGDVVRVVDQTGASLDTLAWIVGNKLSASAGAVKQTLTLRGTTYNGVPQDAGLTPDPPVRL